MTISTKEQLKDHIHSIHDFLRNFGAGYGMTAMKIFMIFYGLKIIEPIIHKTKLNPDICKFSNIIKNAKKKHKKKDNPLSTFIDEDILDDITKMECRDKKFNIAWYMFHQIPRGLSDKVWKQVIKYIDEIPTNKNRNSKKINDTFDVDMSGKVYEYFIGRDDTAISELGAYFTDRHITGYVMDKVKPTLKNGRVRTMIDCFGGSGGFTMGYTQYLNSTFGDKIDWKKDINNIYHYDMNEDVIKIAGLEMFGLTEQLPDKDTNFRRVNTFKNEFGNEKFDYIFTNPPYGGDKKKKNTEELKLDKLFAYIKKELEDIKKQLKDDPENKILLKTKKNRQEQLNKIKENINNDKKIKDSKKVNKNTCSKLIRKYIDDNDMKTCNDKEACSLVLLMALLNKDGVCAGVLKEGVFFDKKYSSVRKCLIENFNVKYVISVPQDQFENTTTKTSIVIFENIKEKTEEIIFYDLIVEKEKEDVFDVVGDEIQIVKCKDDIINVFEKEVCRCHIEDIKDDYSLNYKNYLKNDIKVQKGFKLVKLGDICKFMTSKINSGDMDNCGKFPFYNGKAKNPAGVHSSFNFDFDEYLAIIKGGGAGQGKYGDQIGLGKVFYLHNKNAISNGLYILTVNNKYNIKYLYCYLCKSKNNIMDLATYSTGLGNIKQENLKKYKIPYPDKKTMKKLEPILTKLMNLHEESQKLSNDIPQKEKDICTLMKKLTDGGDYKECKLEDITEILYGGSKISDRNGIYPLYAGGIHPSKYIDEYNIEKNTIIISRSGSSAGLIQKTNSKAFLASYGYYCKLTKNINIEYLYYFLKTNQKIIVEMTKTTIIPNLNRKYLYKMTIKILPDKTIKKQLQPLFDEVDKMKSELETNKKEHSELSVKFMRMIDPEYKNSSDSDIENINNSNDDDTISDKKTKKKKVIVSNDNSDTNNTLKIKNKKKDNS
jgi:type I restriction enzyme S subunit